MSELTPIELVIPIFLKLSFTLKCELDILLQMKMCVIHCKYKSFESVSSRAILYCYCYQIVNNNFFHTCDY